MKFNVFLLILIASIAAAINSYGQGYCTPIEITSNYSYDGVFAEGEYSILPRTGVSCTNAINNLEKPLIFSGTFDFLNEVSSLTQYFGYYQIINYLRDEGYDVILVEYDDANLKVEANAGLLRTIIEQVNQAKPDPNQPIVVAGHGLGGILSRYCLANMEDLGVNHDARLYVSIDAPHQGMYMPISVQYFISFLSGNIVFLSSQENFEFLQEYQQVYNSDLAKQLLKFRLQASTNELILSPEHSQFFDDMESLNDCNGYPTQSRNVAVSFGSWSSNPTNGEFYPQENSFGSDLLPGFLALTVNLNCNQNTDFSLHNTFSVLSGTGNPCGYCPQQWEGSSLVFSQDHILLVTENHFISNFPNGGSMIEVAPGSYMDYYAQLEDIIDNYTSTICTDLTVEKSCNVPTVSALDMRVESYFDAIEANPNRLDLTPFDNVFALQENRSHIGNDVTFSEMLDLLDFLDDELQEDLGYSCAIGELTLSGITVPAGTNSTESETDRILVDNYSIETNATAHLQANSRIEMNDGFVADEGANYVAEIIPCTSKPCNWMAPSEPVFRLSESDEDSTLSEESSRRHIRFYQTLDENEVLVYPNPNQGSFIIKSNDMSSVSVFNATGQLVHAVSNPNASAININLLESGMYFVVIISSDKVTKTTKKVIVQ